MRKRLVIGNWKMYVEELDAAKEFVRTLKRKAGALRGVELGVAAPAPFIANIAHALASSPVRVGAQSIAAFGGQEKGAEQAHTGGVSAAMVKSAGADFCIIGHSERRAQGESDEAVHAQLVAAASAGLTPILCVGERERSPDGAYVAFVAEQLRSALVGAQSLSSKLVIAYEPVWAIGKHAADAMHAPDVREMIIFIRKTLADILARPQALRVPVLYGGSVEPQNARSLIVEGDVGGFLVGHASADVASFFEIASACQK